MEDIFEKYVSYYNKLIEEINKNIKSIEPNNDRGHNAMIFRAMLDTASTINMFCGEMSILHNDFYDKIDTQEVCKDDKVIRIGNKIKTLVISSLKNFLAREDSKLTIYLQHPDKISIGEFIDSNVIFDGIKTGHLLVNELDQTKILINGISHVTTTNRRTVRMETNPVLHEGLCAVYADDSIITPLDEMFESMNKASVTINF